LETHVQSESAGIVDFEATRELRFEAAAIEASYGPNVYSNYLRKHGKRPTRAEAITMGRLIGGRVRADDGSMQPSPAKPKTKKLIHLHKSKPRYDARL
jgi:hypothetical protein